MTGYSWFSSLLGYKDVFIQVLGHLLDLDMCSLALFSGVNGLVLDILLSWSSVSGPFSSRGLTSHVVIVRLSVMRVDFLVFGFFWCYAQTWLFFDGVSG